MSSFGDVLKNLRKNANMTQEELAKSLYISKSTVSGYEQDLRFPPSGILINIADIFHVSVDYLLGREQKCRALYIADLKDEDIELLLTIVCFLREKNHNSDNMLTT